MLNDMTSIDYIESVYISIHLHLSTEPGWDATLISPRHRTAKVSRDDAKCFSRCLGLLVAQQRQRMGKARLEDIFVWTGGHSWEFMDMCGYLWGKMMVFIGFDGDLRRTWLYKWRFRLRKGGVKPDKTKIINAGTMGYITNDITLILPRVSKSLVHGFHRQISMYTIKIVVLTKKLWLIWLMSSAKEISQS